MSNLYCFNWGPYYCCWFRNLEKPVDRSFAPLRGCLVFSAINKWACSIPETAPTGLEILPSYTGGKPVASLLMHLALPANKGTPCDQPKQRYTRTETFLSKSCETCDQATSSEDWTPKIHSTLVKLTLGPLQTIKSPAFIQWDTCHIKSQVKPNCVKSKVK